MEPHIQFFRTIGLPDDMKALMMPFRTLADHILKMPDNAERDVAMRKLLESRDAALRAVMMAMSE